MTQSATVTVLPRPTTRRPVPAQREMGVVRQIQEALRPRARLATFLGCLLGGIVPLATFTVAHNEIDATRPLYTQLSCLLVLGGLVYSAKTVYDWGCRAFGLRAKALGFVVLIEGTMVVSHIGWLGVTALVYLMIINGLSTGCALSLDSRK